MMAQDIRIETVIHQSTTTTYTFTGEQIRDILLGKLSPPPGAKVEVNLHVPDDRWRSEELDDVEMEITVTVYGPEHNA